MKNMLIIIAAGNGTRLGINIPKIFIPIDDDVSNFNKIISLNHIYDKIIIVLSKKGLEYSRKFIIPKHVIIFMQEEAMGVKQAIEIALENSNILNYNSITLQWGDQPFFTDDYRKKFISKHISDKILIPLVLKENPYVCFIFDEEKLKILEKRENENMPNIGFKDIGLFIFSPIRLLEMMSNLSKFPVIGKITNEIRFLKAFEIFHEKKYINYTIDFPSYFELGFNTKEELTLVEKMFNFKNKNLCI